MKAIVIFYLQNKLKKLMSKIVVTQAYLKFQESPKGTLEVKLIFEIKDNFIGLTDFKVHN